MRYRCHWNMALWALKTLSRHPWESLLTAGVLVSLTLVMGVPVLVSQGLSRRIETALSSSPALVVRRIDPTGWRPIEVTAVSAAARIPGVIAVRPRIWGRVPGAKGPVTVTGWMPLPSAPSLLPLPVPAPGTVSVGGSMEATAGRLILFRADGRRASFLITGLDGVAVPPNGVVVMNPDDARGMLDIPDGYATDLAVDVFHETEIPAVSAELAAALPFPVHIDDRQAARTRYLSATGAAAGTRIVRYFPAVTALVLLVLVNLRRQVGEGREIRLLTAVGWTLSDIHRCNLSQALWIGLPSVAAGAAAAYFTVTLPQLARLGALLWGGSLPPGLSFALGTDAAMTAAALAAMILAPYLTAVGLSDLAAGTWRSVRHRLQEHGGRP